MNNQHVWRVIVQRVNLRTEEVVEQRITTSDPLIQVAACGPVEFIGMLAEKAYSMVKDKVDQ